MITDTDSAGLKRIGEAFLYLRGMQSTVGLKSVPVDLIVFDELDESTAVAKAMARERLAHSSYKRIIELSNPSLPGFGIDESYQASDQRHWNIQCPGCGYWVTPDKEFPAQLGQEVTIIRADANGRHFRACTRCGAELDLARGKWVPDFPGRPIHGYLISQLFSSRVDAAEILNDYRITRYPDRFFNLKIGIPWADTHRRVDASTVLSLCTDALRLERSDEPCSMGVDTGRALHVVILRPDEDDEDYDRHQLVYLGVHRDFRELDDLMSRFNVDRAVIDGLPETHATLEFAQRHPGKVFLSFFNDAQRGGMKWEHRERSVLVNRTDALDASRAAVRRKMVLLPRRDGLVETFAEHMAADAKKLEEDEATGAQRYRYIKTGENHFSFAFTYAWMASADRTGFRAWRSYYRKLYRQRGLPWPPPRRHR